MSPSLHSAILELVGQADAAGVAMGTIVDQLVRAGHKEAEVEAAIWLLLQDRQLTPSGYVRRKLRVRSEDGKPASARSYEFMLVAWSPERDDEEG